MADRTAIEWSDATWNCIAGCSRMSEGCRNCFAERLAARGLPGFEGLARFADRTDGTREARWTGAVEVREHLIDRPLRWKKPRKIFVNSMSDIFHDAVPDEVIDRIFAVMALCPQHTFQILTKRPERMRHYVSRPRPIATAAIKIGADHKLNNTHIDRCIGQRVPLSNVWLGVSVEDQVTADVRIPYLLSTPAAIRFISFEPALGFADIAWALSGNPIEIAAGFLKRGQFAPGMETLRPLDQVIMGGESGPSARPMHPDWVRETRDQCAAASVPFFFKQWGEWVSIYDRDREDQDWRRVPKPGDWGRKRFLNLAGGQGFHGECLHMMKRVGKRSAGRLLDGVEHNGMPEVRLG